jgi:hypothetical protein
MTPVGLIDAMTLKQTSEAFEALDSARASGRTVVESWLPYGLRPTTRKR